MNEMNERDFESMEEAMKYMDEKSNQPQYSETRRPVYPRPAVGQIWTSNKTPDGWPILITSTHPGCAVGLKMMDHSRKDMRGVIELEVNGERRWVVTFMPYTMPSRYFGECIGTMSEEAIGAIKYQMAVEMGFITAE